MREEVFIELLHPILASSLMKNDGSWPTTLVEKKAQYNLMKVAHKLKQVVREKGWWL